MDCRLCSPDTPEGRNNRLAWGCDGPASFAAFTVPCWTCQGRGGLCETCGGSGEVEIDRCPNALPDPVHFRVCELVALLECGVLPARGGLEDQSLEFLEALHFVAPLKAELEKRQQEQAEKQAKQRATRGG